METENHSENISVAVDKLTLGPFQSNCYLVREESAEKAVIIDPGDEADRINSYLEENGLTPVVILATHGHIDHVGAVRDLKETHEIPFYLHPKDEYWVEGLSEQARTFGLPDPGTPEVDEHLEGGQRLEFQNLTFEVVHTPGHTPGEVSFVLDSRCFVGDCVFQGSIGRTDFPGGDQATLLKSIREEILSLPGETVLHPGHGPDTTVEREARSNPFLQ